MANPTWHFPLVGIALDTPVKSKRNKTKDLPGAKAKIRRVVDGATESVVKVSGGTRGAAHMKAHMDYISRNGDIELENERGEIIDTRERLREEHKDWSEDLGKSRKNSRDTINIVLSMPVDTEPKAVQQAARAFAKEEFGENFQYLMALHHPGNDKKTTQPHVHLTVKALGFDGTKLDPRKADLQDWRETWAAKMREQNYEVEATPRRSRGVVQKAQRQPIHAMESRPERNGSQIQARKTKEAGIVVKTGHRENPNPARENIAKRQNKIREAWIEGAAELEKTGQKDDQELAEKIREFVKKMPRRLLDERGELETTVAAKIEEIRKKETGHKAPSKDEKDKGIER